MKYFIFALAMFYNILSYSQTFEIMGGVSKNTFFDIEENRPGNFAKYSSGVNSYFGLGFQNIELFSLKFGISFVYEKYGGVLEARSGGLGGAIVTNAEVEKSILSISIFPLNKKLYKKLNFKLGIVISPLIRESFSGTLKSTLMVSQVGQLNGNLNDLFVKYSSSPLIGLKGALDYDFKLTDKIAISPSYSFYIGVVDEFKPFSRSIQSMRHFLGVGLKQFLN